MKKSLALVLIIMVLVVFTACGQKTEASEVTTTSTPETTSVTKETTTANTDLVEIDMGTLINETSNGKPVVTIVGDSGDLCSFDFSEMSTNKIEVTLDEKVERNHLYITMSGNVTAHSLESDGSLFDGIVYITDGKAEFSVTYDEEKTVNFVVNVPA